MLVTSRLKHGSNMSTRITLDEYKIMLNINKSIILFVLILICLYYICQSSVDIIVDQL